MNNLILFTTKDFRGHNPVGSCAIVWARDRRLARRKFKAAFKAAGLPNDGGTAFTIQTFDPPRNEEVAGDVNILLDGEY